MLIFGSICLMLGMGCAFAAAEVYDTRDTYMRELRMQVRRYRHG